jgi:hypothetical protein
MQVSIQWYMTHDYTRYVYFYSVSPLHYMNARSDLQAVKAPMHEHRFLPLQISIQWCMTHDYVRYIHFYSVSPLHDMNARSDPQAEKHRRMNIRAEFRSSLSLSAVGREHSR